MLNAMINVIIEEELYDTQYIQGNVDGFQALKEKVKDFKHLKNLSDKNKLKPHTDETRTSEII